MNNSYIKHNNTCLMSFGRPSKHSNYPRCEELKNGKKPRKSWGYDKRMNEARQLKEIREHDCKKSNCGIVCTFGDW